MGKRHDSEQCQARGSEPDGRHIVVNDNPGLFRSGIVLDGARVAHVAMMAGMTRFVDGGGTPI